jgi:succinate dehydrogenase flavin-adding protein (antitoxin of CptAB toxin-antitoxin module)
MTTKERKELMELIEQREMDIIKLLKKREEYDEKRMYDVIELIDVDIRCRKREIEEYKNELEGGTEEFGWYWYRY